MNFSEKSAVVSALWNEYKDDEDFAAFMKYNNIGCPLAFSFSQGLIVQLSPQGISMVEETFDQLIELLDVSEEEIDEVLPEKNLGAIFVFAHNKKKFRKDPSENSELVEIPADFDNDNPNRGDLFSHYAHAFNALYGTQFFNLDHISDYGVEHGRELTKKAGEGDAEAMLTMAIVYCTDTDDYTKAHSLAKSAINKAQNSGKDLGRFYFGYGFALEQVEDYDAAIDAHEKALNLGFGAAAFNYGRLLMVHNLDLSSAIRTWKIGRDKYKDYVCKEMLEDLEISPGVYRATVDGADGSAEILIASDNPGGLGTLK